MFSPNPIMEKAGFVPAAEVARVLNKAVSTIHRMVADGRIDGARDGRSLYVSISSLEKYFLGDGNNVMAQAVREAFNGCGSVSET